MKTHLPLIALSLTLLSACARVDDADGDMQNVKAQLNVTEMIDDLSNQSRAGETPMMAQAANIIPLRFHGRWGVDKKDCDAELGEAEGLMTVDETGIKFFESRANLLEQQPNEDGGFTGNFSFSGEGEDWEKIVTLTRTGDGLTRSDEDGSTTYALCV